MNKDNFVKVTCIDTYTPETTYLNIANINGIQESEKGWEITCGNFQYSISEEDFEKNVLPNINVKAG